MTGAGSGGRRILWTGVATGYGFGLSALPIAAYPGGAEAQDVVVGILAVVLAAVTAAAFARWAATRATMWVGVLLVALSGLLYAVTPAGVSTAIIAVLAGAGAGLCTGGRPWAGSRTDRVVGAALAVASVLVPFGVLGPGSAGPYVVAAAGAGVAAAIRARRSPTTSAGGSELVPSAPGARRVLVGAAAAGALLLVAWTGTNDPRLSWFGPVAWHGPRTGSSVAITFDDGPNDTASLEIARLLDERGVKGTFFEVGSAVRRRPDVARRLVADGHLIGNHSYHHDYYGWLNPLYPEMQATQRVIGRDVGVCPRFFRPPHGQRTPLMNLQAARRGMAVVTWDVSAGDWATHDPQLVARRILDRVRPGSIILLHDSLDGHVDADRRVVVEALPIILDGLERKGLDAVRVDELLGGSPYLPERACR